jgi:membrane fusion protein, multidrug efflux system
MCRPDRCFNVVVVIIILGLLGACSRQPAKKAVSAPDVTVVRPVKKEVIKYLEYTGNTAALESVDIRARVAGFLQKICFVPGAKVKTGELLFVIDPRQYEATVKEAKGKLDATKASSKLAQTEVAIAQQLESKEAISALKLEKQVAERDVAGADVELAAAALDKAKLDLEWTQVTSPIDGRVSRNKVDVGNLVGATEKTLLTTVVNDSSVYAYFSVSELDLLPILRRFVKEGKDREPQPKKVPVFLGLADETGYPHEGTFDFAETTVDQSTGTIQVRGIFPNPDGLLMAGMYVRVRVPVEKQEALLVPDIAIQFDQGGQYVMVINDENVAQQKRIKAGRQVGEMTVVEKGLTEKDRVITLGGMRARPGSKVNPTSSPADSGKSGSSDGKKGNKE